MKNPIDTQKPGGLSRWDTLVHFGSSAEKSQSSLPSIDWIKKVNSLCMPFLYRLTFRSNTVYLSFGSISSSVGISFFQRSSCFVERPFLASAVSRVEITLSTARKRARCRAFWWRERRQGIFLYHLTLAFMSGPEATNSERNNRQWKKEEGSIDGDSTLTVGVSLP